MQNNQNRGGQVCRQTPYQSRKRIHSARRSSNYDDVMSKHKVLAFTGTGLKQPAQFC